MRISRHFKRMLPKSISHRFTLIILLPILIVQATSLYLFIDKNLRETSKRMSLNLIHHITQVVNSFEANKLYNIESDTNLHLFHCQKITSIPEKHKISNMSAKTFRHFLKRYTRHKYLILFENPNIKLYIKTMNGNLLFVINKNQILGTRDLFFALLILLLPIILFIVARIFLKNQIRPILHLSKIMTSVTEFDNKKMPFLTPQGAREIKQLTQSFNNLMSEIQKFLTQRTLMLSGISHDLRTYITRAKLQIAVINNPLLNNMSRDLCEMETMLDEFIEFSKQQTYSAKQDIELCSFTTDIINHISGNTGANIHIDIPTNICLKTNQTGLNRCFLNLIANSEKFADNIYISAKALNNKILILVEDDGCGIPENELESIVVPFYKIDNARTVNGSGSGLGLSIVKNIITSCGGTLILKKSQKYSGLSVTMEFNHTKD